MKPNEFRAVKVIVHDVRKIPDEVFNNMFFDDTTSSVFHLYPKEAYIPIEVFRLVPYKGRESLFTILSFAVITGDEAHLKRWSKLTNVKINLNVEKMRLKGLLKEWKDPNEAAYERLQEESLLKQGIWNSVIRIKRGI